MNPLVPGRFIIVIRIIIIIIEHFQMQRKFQLSCIKIW